MGKLKKTTWTAAEYEEAARRYSARLPLEHFMEALPQSTQREITLASLAILKVHLPDVQDFSELLIQYHRKGRLRRVVPDNMVRRCSKEPVTIGSFNIELEPVGPLLVLEYVSAESMRKDYKESFRKYERELRVPYCLMFYPEKQDVKFWRHRGKDYEALAPDAQGRWTVPELELQMGLLDRWVRFWYRGELLPLPADLQRQVTQLRERVEQAEQRAELAEAEVARLRALLEQSQPPKGRTRKRPS